MLYKFYETSTNFLRKPKEILCKNQHFSGFHNNNNNNNNYNNNNIIIIFLT